MKDDDHSLFGVSQKGFIGETLIILIGFSSEIGSMRLGMTGKFLNHNGLALSSSSGSMYN